jgi:hypothetical protein
VAGALASVVGDGRFQVGFDNDIHAGMLLQLHLIAFGVLQCVLNANLFMKMVRAFDADCLVDEKRRVAAPIFADYAPH